MKQTESYLEFIEKAEFSISFSEQGGIFFNCIHNEEKGKLGCCVYCQNTLGVALEKLVTKILEQRKAIQNEDRTR